MNEPEINPAVSIEAASVSDYAQAVELWRDALGDRFDPAFDTAERIRIYMDRNPGLSSAARQDSKLVGILLCGHDGRRGSLYHLAVAPRYRRHGIARRLVNRSLKALAQQGIVTAFCFTDRRHDVARKAWSALRFEHAPTVEYRYRGFGNHAE